MRTLQSMQAWSKTNWGIWQNAVNKQISKGWKTNPNSNVLFVVTIFELRLASVVLHCNNSSGRVFSDLLKIILLTSNIPVARMMYMNDRVNQYFVVVVVLLYYPYAHGENTVETSTVTWHLMIKTKRELKHTIWYNFHDEIHTAIINCWLKASVY